MPTPPRVEFHGSIHHVMNRGVRGMDIFNNEHERRQFLEYLRSYKNQYQINVLAYALMPNHFHLLIQSMDGRMGSFMGALQSAYATWFNNQGDRESGRLFQSRYQSEIVQSGSYFSTVLRYVVMNPVRSGFDFDKANRKWTSLRGWSKEDSITDWKVTFDLLENVTSDNFHEFLDQDISRVENEYENNLRTVREIQIVGDDDFLQEVLDEEDEPVRSETRDQSPYDPDKILETVSEHFDLDGKDALLESVRKRNNSNARYTSYYLLRIRAHQSLSEIAELFGISEASVSKGIRCFEKRMSQNESIKSLLRKWNINQ